MQPALRLIDGFAARREQVEQRAVSLARRHLARFDGWGREALVAELAAIVADVVLTAQRSVAGLTDAYLSQITSLVAERLIPGVGGGVTGSLRGVPLYEVYARLDSEVGWQRSRGKTPSEAQAVAAERLAAMVSADMGLAFTTASQRFMMAAPRGLITGYRRIVRPERSESGVCGLCLVAADRRYTRKDLMPIHARCKCVVLPEVDNADPAGVLNLSREELGLAYDAAGSNKGADLKRVRVKVYHHSELGPQLRDASHQARQVA